MVHLHLWCFQLREVQEEKAKSFLLAQINLKRESFCNRFQVIGFEQKFALGCKKPGLLCLRGSRIVCRKRAEFEVDADVSHTVIKT